VKDFPMNKEDLIEKSLLHLVDNNMDYETRREFWQKKVTKTHLKLISLAFESKIHNIPDDTEVMGIPVNSTLLYLHSQVREPSFLGLYPKATEVVMLSDAGVHWCNLVRGVITGKFDDHISYEVKK
jgi:hypothetical protein